MRKAIESGMVIDIIRYRLGICPRKIVDKI